MPAREVGRRHAGPNHDVVSVIGEGKYRRRPCQGCPWLVENKGAFPAEAFRHSANTAEDMATSTFACHETGVDHVMTCAGFMLRGAEHNMNVRMKMVTGEIDLDQVDEDGRLLHSGYTSMAVANGVPLRDPALRNVRLSSYEEEETN